jgi:Tfp pilus assembly protein PilO
MQIKTDKILKELQKNKYLQLFPDFKEEKTQKITYVALTLVALSFFGLFAISPTVSTISKLNKELKDNKYVEQQLQKKIMDLSSLQEKYNNLQADLPEVYAAIPTNPSASLLVAQIQSLAKDSGVILNTVQVFSVDSSSGNKQYSSFNFSLNGNGDYIQISKFVSSLNTMRRITTQNIISITKQSGKENTLSISIKGEAYFKNL